MSTAFQVPTREIPQPAPRHLKVTGAAPALGFEPCEDFGCSVGHDGTASSCRRDACSSCGCSGTNLTAIELLDSLARLRIRCICGHTWLRSSH